MRWQRTGLWRHPDFLKLWAGQTVSLFGSLVGRIALPLVAILTLDASPAAVALLTVADLAPGILVGLYVGAWVDRLPRRPILLWADVGRALLLLTVPAAALLGLLRLEQLYLVAVLNGTLTILFDVAYQSYLPTLVRREALVEGNSKLQASGAVAEVSSFGIGGALVQALGPPLAVLVDALSFGLSAVSLALIRAREPPPSPHAEPQPGWDEIVAGLRHVWSSPLLRAVAGAAATRAFFVYLWASMLLLFLTRDLQLEPALFGALFAIGGISSLGGAVLAPRAVRRLGLGRALVLGLLLASASLLFVPLAGGPLWLVVLLVGAQQLFDGPATIYEIHTATLVQAVTPAPLLGRVLASIRVQEGAAILGGVLLGGLLGETVGPRTTMLVGALGTLPAVLWLVFSPVRALRELPAAPRTAS